MKTRMFMFVEDYVDEGASALDEIVTRCGVSSIAANVTYHSARDICPHGSTRVRFMESGRTRFIPNAELYRDSLIEPQPCSWIQDRDPLEALVRQAKRRNLGVDAWTVFLHSSSLGQQLPALTVRNAFGDRLISHLCPANPSIVPYVRALITDMGNRGVRSILAESLHYEPFAHGYHHERSMVDLDELASFLLGVCFCDHCVTWAKDRGVDGDQAKVAVAHHLDSVLTDGEPGDGPTLSPGSVEEVCGRAVAQFLDVRRAAVTALVETATATAEQASLSFAFIDPAGAATRFSTGEALKVSPVESGWRFGIDAADLGRIVDEYVVTGYTRRPEDISSELLEYREALGDSAALTCLLRPGYPDTDSTENLIEKISAAQAIGDSVSFYNYGLYRLRELSRIGKALAACDIPST